MNQKRIGLFLKELRKEKGLTQEQLSEILGVTNRSISRWENGVNMPDFDLVIEIANYFDVSMEELLNGERKKEIMDKKSEEIFLKVADYNNDEKIIFSKRVNFVFIIGIIAFTVYAILEQQGLTATDRYENIASFALGIVFGVLIFGVLYTSRYMIKIKAFKQRVLNWNNNQEKIHWYNYIQIDDKFLVRVYQEKIIFWKKNY